MRLVMKHDNLMVESRFLWASIAIFLGLGVLLFRLWYVQIYKGEYYRKRSETNRVRRIEISVPRGVIYDRNGEVLLGNRPFYDLVYVPQYVVDRDATLKVLSRLLHVPTQQFEQRIRMAQGQPKFVPVDLKRNLSQHEVSVIESNKIFLPGVEVQVVPRRDYKPNTPPHLVGYLREIDKDMLEKMNEKHPNNPYMPGDLVGKQGLEARWEEYLRGKRGFQLIQVDAHGRRTHSTDESGWEVPVVPAIPGSDLELSIDLELQNAVKDAFNGKYGAVIVLDPRNGEILAEVSEPGFDPTLMQNGLSPEDWRALTSNPFKPFLDKTTGGEFAPGSIYKPIVAIAGLEEGVVTPDKQFYCPGHFELGNQTFACHDRAGHGFVDMRRAMMKSCDVYFYHLGVELGVDRIAKYAQAFGLGNRLGVDLNSERPGLVPTSAWKQLVHRFPWTMGDTPNVSIGQGYNLATPMQMAAMYAAFANGGKVWRPYVVKKITNHVGETVLEEKPHLVQETSIVKPQTFKIIQNILKDVVMDKDGTGHRAVVEGHTIAGKTGSVQVVSLKKNRNQTDVSIKWKEHAIFAAFTPVENPEIAIIVVSQNDKVGGGGSKAAAPVAQKIIKTYYDLKTKRDLTIAKTQQPVENDGQIKN